MLLQMLEILSEMKCWIACTSLVGDGIFFLEVCAYQSQTYFILYVWCHWRDPKITASWQGTEFSFFHAIMQGSSDSLRCKA